MIAPTRNIKYPTRFFSQTGHKKRLPVAKRMENLHGLVSRKKNEFFPHGNDKRGCNDEDGPFRIFGLRHREQNNLTG